MNVHASETAAGWRLQTRLARARRADPAADFCLWRYEPPTLPTRDSLRSDALLYQSLHAAGVSDRALAVCDAIRAAAGPFRTVFGVKHHAGAVSWEFYFYDYRRQARGFGTSALAQALSPLVPVAAPLTADALPYFMFSVELTADHLEGGAPLDRIDLYMGNPGSTVSSGLCYGLSAEGMEFRNAYYFFDSATEGDAILGKLRCTAHAPADLDPDALLWPDVARAVTVIANKRWNDAVYLSRIGAADLALCLSRLQVRGDMADFVAENAPRLSHLLFDIGYDWRWDTDGPRFTKASWYGLL